MGVVFNWSMSVASTSEISDIGWVFIFVSEVFQKIVERKVNYLKTANTNIV